MNITFDKIYGLFQRLGRAFMLPIAILPVAGLLLASGTTFTSEATLQAYHLQDVMGQGTLFYTLFYIAKSVGLVIFENISFLFAIGVAIGMAKKEKEIAAIAAFIAYFTMNATVSALLYMDGRILPDDTLAASVSAGTIMKVCGVWTLQTGVFGGVLVGLGVAFLHNHFRTQKLPDALSFYSGRRFVPIISALVYVLVGIAVYLIWPFFQNLIMLIGQYVSQSGYLGTFIFGVTKRALVPFGLHHVFYMPFWQTALGASMEIGGKIVEGGQNIFFAQLSDPGTQHFSAQACRYFSGEYIFMLFGLPGAALAMYHSAKAEEKNFVKSIMIPAALTCFLTGVTEPLEFCFLFVAPQLFLLQVILAGSCYMVAQILNITIGLTFSGGFIDFCMFGILQGNAKTNWLLVIPVGILYFFLYYISFRFFILRFDLATPGRRGKEEEKSIYKKDGQEIIRLHRIIEGLGGLENIDLFDCCATRLRCYVKNENLIDKEILKTSGNSGVFLNGNTVQLIIGPQVGYIKSRLESIMEDPSSSLIEEEIVREGLFSQDRRKIVRHKIFAPAHGEIFPLREVDDIVFSSELLGKGFALIPEEGRIYSPADGVIYNSFTLEHAMEIHADGGSKILIHIGLDITQSRNVHFQCQVKEGERVQVGTLLVTYDLEGLIREGLSSVTPVIIGNTEECSEISEVERRKVKAGEEVLEIS